MKQMKDDELEIGTSYEREKDNSYSNSYSNSYNTRTEPRDKTYANPHIVKRVSFGPTMIKTYTIGSKINQDNKMETPTIQREPDRKKTRKGKKKFKINRELRIANININGLKGKTT